MFECFKKNRSINCWISKSYNSIRSNIVLCKCLYSIWGATVSEFLAARIIRQDSCVWDYWAHESLSHNYHIAWNGESPYGMPWAMSGTWSCWFPNTSRDCPGIPGWIVRLDGDERPVNKQWNTSCAPTPPGRWVMRALREFVIVRNCGVTAEHKQEDLWSPGFHGSFMFGLPVHI